MTSLRTNKTLAVTSIALAAVAVLYFLAPQIQNIGKITSWEVDRLLYDRLDEYNQTILQTPGIAELFATAVANPSTLSEENRRTYLAYRRRFFSGWEAAWNYHNAGIFDDDRWHKWNTWYVDEVTNSPEFGWVENRARFSGGFLNHVDRAMTNR